MTQTETKKRGFKSRGRKKTGFPMTYLTEAQAIQIFLNLNQFTWIYKPQFALELSLPFTLTLYSWAEKGRPLCSQPAGVLITLWLANEFEFKALKEILVLKKESTGNHTIYKAVFIIIKKNVISFNRHFNPQFVKKCRWSYDCEQKAFP